MSEARPLVAAVQFAPERGGVAANRAWTLVLAETAADRGARLVVLPECALTGYVFHDKDDLAALAEPVPGPTAAAWSELACRRGVWIVGGLAERADGAVYNSAVAAGPDGRLHVYRKCHLWGIERALYRAGDAPLLFDTPWGRVGVGICYDLWFPELVRAMALAGAGLLVFPANWSTNPRLSQPFDAHGLPLAYHMAVAAACANELTVVCADRVGREDETVFLGSSLAIGPNGRPLAGPASPTGETILLAEWPDAGGARRVGQSHLASRRGDLYTLAWPAAPVSVPHGGDATTTVKGDA